MSALNLHMVQGDSVYTDLFAAVKKTLTKYLDNFDDYVPT